MASECPQSGSAATMADLRAAVCLVARGVAGSVTIVGIPDAEAAAAAVADSAAGVSIEILVPCEPARPASTVRVRRAAANRAALPAPSDTHHQRRPRSFVRRAAIT
jgi:hypothetical protein